MANEQKPRSAARSASRSGQRSRSSADTRKRRPARKPKQKTKRVRRTVYPEFRPDKDNVSIFKVLHMTEYQQLRLLRWTLYVAVCVASLVVQDTIMSRISIFGTTTDLAVAAMLVITVVEGSDVGSVFILVASCIYYFSGSAPGPYTVGMLSVMGLCASLFRQQVWHRSTGSILFCSGLAILAYEIGTYVVGMMMGLTRWYRFPRFFMTGVLTILASIPLYYLINRIGQIGGNTWKE